MPSAPDDLQRVLRRARRSPLFDRTAVPAVDQRVDTLLPHRPPMLLVGRVVALDVETGRGVAHRRLEASDTGFAGHFPGDPLYPGVLQVETAGQLALFVARRRAGAVGPNAVRLVRVLDAVFQLELRPGTDLTVLSMLVADDGYVQTSAAQILVGDSVACVCAFEAMEAAA